MQNHTKRQNKTWKLLIDGHLMWQLHTFTTWCPVIAILGTCALHTTKIFWMALKQTNQEPLPYQKFPVPRSIISYHLLQQQKQFDNSNFSFSVNRLTKQWKLTKPKNGLWMVFLNLNVWQNVASINLNSSRKSEAYKPTNQKLCKTSCIKTFYIVLSHN